MNASAMLYSVGESGHPCLSPSCKDILVVVVVFICIWYVWFEMAMLTRLMMLSGTCAIFNPL